MKGVQRLTNDKEYITTILFTMKGVQRLTRVEECQFTRLCRPDPPVPKQHNADDNDDNDDDDGDDGELFLYF